MRRLALVAALALAFPAAASAHATLRSTTPAFGHEVRSSPRTIRLHFDQYVKVLPGSLQVLDAHGRNYAGAVRVEGLDVIAPVRPLPAGGYTVRWRAISADSHVVSGVWTFGLDVPAPSVNDAYGAGGPGPAEDAVRWIWFLGMALTIGALGLRLVCLRGLDVPLRLDRRLTVAAGAGVVVALQAGIAAFSLRAEDALQLPIGRFLYGDLSPMAATPFGRAFVAMTLGFALVLALIYLAWVTDRTAFLVPALVLAVGFAGGLSLSGHDAVDPGDFWATKLADWVHLAAASLWIGGLASLVGLVWFGAPHLRRRAFVRFSRLATVLIALVLGAGTYLGIERLPHPSDLWTQGYGQVLLVKIGLVCVALAWGGVHHFLIRPALERADEGFLTRVGRSLAGESLVGVAVLLVAAVLVDSRPPAAAAAVAPAGPLRIPTGGTSFGVVAADGSVWIAGTDSGKVLRLDPASGRVRARIPAGQRLFTLTAVPGGIWAVSQTSNSVVRIDTATGQVTARVPVGSTPYAAAAGFGSLWVSNAGDGTVSRITGGRVVAHISVGVEPNGLAAVGKYLWVTDHTLGILARIDPRTNRVSGQVPLAGADWVTAAAGSLWVSEETNVVARVDPRTLRVLKRVPVGGNPLGSAVVRGKLWVPCIDTNEVVVVDPRRGKVVRRFGAGRGPIVVLPYRGHVWVTHTSSFSAWRF